MTQAREGWGAVGRWMLEPGHPPWILCPPLNRWGILYQLLNLSGLQPPVSQMGWQQSLGHEGVARMKGSSLGSTQNSARLR